MTLLSDDRADPLERQEAPSADGPRPDAPHAVDRGRRRFWSVPTHVWLGLTLLLGLVLRLVNLNAFGFNSDEAVYAGQAASLAGNPLFVGQFPIFRAHPLLLPTLLSPLFSSGTPDLRGRVVVALFGVATLLVVYLLGRDLFGPKTGVLAALILAVMPYHLVVTRQLLLDGPAVFWMTLAFWLLVRFVRSNQFEWLAASAATFGLAVLTKETAIVVTGALFLFLLVSPAVRRPARSVALALGILIGVSLIFPLAISVAGHTSTGQNYLTWQLTRASNHAGTFYLTTIPASIGWLVVIVAGLSLLYRSNRTWRELILVLWIAVPLVAFEIYPLKGYQYLLPVAPPLALLAARGLATFRVPRRWSAWARSAARPVAVAVVLASLVPSAWTVVFPSAQASALAGQGGVPGGREAGHWIGRNLIPGTELMTIGPSMANILEYYGHRPALGLSVSSNPLHRNPAYTPIINPDRSVRTGQFGYLVWDAYSAFRSPSTARRLETLVARYHGVPVHTEAVNRHPVIVIYEVHP